MFEIPKCPKCGSDTAPDLIKVNIIQDALCIDWYEETYKCRCSCHFVTLHPRKIYKDNVWIHRIEEHNVEGEEK